MTVILLITVRNVKRSSRPALQMPVIKPICLIGCLLSYTPVRIIMVGKTVLIVRMISARSGSTGACLMALPYIINHPEVLIYES